MPSSAIFIIAYQISARAVYTDNQGKMQNEICSVTVSNRKKKPATAKSRNILIQKGLAFRAKANLK
ncbi:hypothetical protein A8P50_09210 [Yersinia pestis]|nr:hypothetical protein A8P50_09210 [Yersinia pestis]